MMNTLDGYPIEMFTNETAEKNKIGTKENSNGVLFFVAKNDRKMRIEVGYGLEGALPDALASSIIRNDVAPYFKKNQYYEGTLAGLNGILAATRGEYKGNPNRDEENKLPIGLIIFIIFIIFTMLRNKGRGWERRRIMFICPEALVVLAEEDQVAEDLEVLAAAAVHSAAAVQVEVGDLSNYSKI